MLEIWFAHVWLAQALSYTMSVLISALDLQKLQATQLKTLIKSCLDEAIWSPMLAHLATLMVVKTLII